MLDNYLKKDKKAIVQNLLLPAFIKLTNRRYKFNKSIEMKDLYVLISLENKVSIEPIKDVVARQYPKVNYYNNKL